MSGPTNYQTQELVKKLSGSSSSFWKRIKKDLLKPTRQRRVVNLYKIEKAAKDGETIVVPGKVLSIGNVEKKLTVAALMFSSEAKRKIEGANGKIMTLSELFAKNPDGKNVRILG